jgi:RNA polymerase sigma factor (sigma-70 family)
MSSSALAASLRNLRGSLVDHQRREESDEQLLDAFLNRHDDSAFAALVRRHGPMVLHVCRRVLGHEQDAEDAFQAAFLVLAQGAAALRNKTRLAAFLHGIAYRTAMKAKQSAARRRKRESRTSAPPQTNPAEELAWREVRTLLDEEIDGLPEIYRVVFVMVYLEDLSREESAWRLGLKPLTVAKRLLKARKRLSQRLALRGVELTAVLAATAVATTTASALPTGLVAKTLKAVSAAASGKGLAGIVSASVIELVQGVTAAMIGSKAKIATVLLLAASVLGGAGVYILTSPQRQPGQPLPVTLAGDQTAEPPRSARTETTKTVMIQGRVLDPEDKPVKDARLNWMRCSKDLSNPEDRLRLVERGRSDENGRFRITLPSGESLDDSLRQLVVTAAGYGLTWLELPKGKPYRDVTVRLRKDVTIRGRVLSMEGKPLAGVRVRVDHLEDMPNGRFDDYLAYWEQDWNKALRLATRRLDLPAKNASLPCAVTDTKGRFQLSGGGSDRMVYLEIRGEGIAHATLPIGARPGFDPSALNKSARNRATMQGPSIPAPPPVLYGPTFEYVALPARIVEGVVRELGSGKPIPGVRIHGSADNRTQSEAISDKEGRYCLEGLPKVKRYAYFYATSPGDGPWLTTIQGGVEGAEGLQPVRVDFTMARGVILTGRVIDRATGKGVVGSVMFVYLPDNKFAGKQGYDPFMGSYATDSEGRFRLKVAPGTGVLEAAATGMRGSNRFMPAQFDAEDRKHITFTADGDFVTIPGGAGFLKVHNAVKWMDLAPDAGVVEQNLYLERGATAKVRIDDAQGSPLAGTIVSGIDAMPAQHVQEAYVASEAECTIVALDPHQPRKVIFYHPKRRLAGTLLVRGDEKQPLTVRLTPTGTVTGCIKDADGQPLQGAEIDIGAFGQPISPNLNYLYVHLKFTGLPVRTDKQGRFVLEAVVPDEKFALGIRRLGAYLDGGPRTRGLQIKTSQTLDLGDIRVKPGP